MRNVKVADDLAPMISKAGRPLSKADFARQASLPDEKEVDLPNRKGGESLQALAVAVLQSQSPRRRCPRRALHPTSPSPRPETYLKLSTGWMLKFEDSETEALFANQVGRS